MQNINKRNIPYILLFILCLGICLRICYLQEISKEPWFTNPLYDPQYNDYWAKGIATGDWTLPPYVNDPEIRTTPHGRPPGYPYLLSIIYRIFGRNPWTPRIIQYTFGILNIILAWYLAKKYYNLRFANLLALFMATFWGFIYFESQLTYPVFAITLLLIWFFLIFRWKEKTNKKIYPFLLGLTLGIFALFRPNGLLLLVLFPLLFLMFTPEKPSFPRFFVLSFLFLLGITIPIVPCFIRNYIVAHDFVFISSYGGLNFYVGNHPKSNGAEPRIPELKKWIGCDEWSCFDYPAIVRGLGKSLGKPSLSFSEANKYFYKSALNNIWNYPYEWLSLTLKKFLLFWGPMEITNDTVPSWDKYYSKTLKFLPGFPLYFALFISGIVIGLFSFFHKSNRDDYYKKIFILVSLLIVIIYFFSVLPYFVASRYRIPIMPFIMILGVFSINEFITAIQQNQKIKIFFITTLFFIALFMGSKNLTGYEPSQSVWFFRNGVSASLAGDEIKAKFYYKKALELDPNNLFARINYSQVLGRTGRPSEGIYILTKNFSLPMSSPPELNALGYLFEMIGDYEKAQYFYSRAIVNHPSFTLAHANIANLFFNQHNFVEAKCHYEIVKSLQPNNPIPYFQLARIAEFDRKYIEAASFYEKCLELNPQLYIAWNNLGWIYEQIGNKDKAEQAYKKCIHIKPDYVLARINYANLLIQSNNFSNAKEQIDTAIKYDPTNCQVYLLLGNIYINQYELVNAVVAFQKSLELCPDNAKAWNNLGLALSLSGQEEQAREMWQKALQHNDTLAETYINLITSYENQGEIEKAISILNQALEKIPDNEELKTLQKRLIPTKQVL
ncbi:MAG TPA: tetratricopeptide repeat protein [Candidatus Hydrogenedens sp.]|nr:tetratricopeptide repeat protein [Candidatus Hydrogenedens sp.]